MKSDVCMKLLNLGCGSRYHASWTNIDFVSTCEAVVAHNLLQGIPMENECFDVVYHSHVLEHFTKIDGELFLQECYRVLKPNGIIRIAIPDLEQIAREYLKNLELALQGNEKAKHNYNWIMLEMYDQVVRSKSGGDMAAYIFQPTIPNEEYVFERIGEEGRNLRKFYLSSLDKINIENEENTDKRSLLRKFFSKIKQALKKIIYNDNKNLTYTNLGKFRLGGEIHQWMYDRFSLTQLLTKIGFKDVRVNTAFTSAIAEWNKFELESKDGVIFKPDSLFIEAHK